MGGNIAKEHVEALINIVQDIKKTYEYNTSFIVEKEAETQDLLHELELGNFDYKKGNKLARELRKIRKARRQASDQNRALKFLYDYFHGKSIIRDLRRIQQDIIKEEQKMEARVYVPRVREDLTFTDKQTVSSIKEAFNKAK